MIKVFRLDIPCGLDGHHDMPRALASVMNGRVVAAALAAGPNCLAQLGRAIELATPLVESTMGPVSEWFSDTRPCVTPDGAAAFYRSESGRTAVLVEERRSEGATWPDKGWAVTYFSDHGEDKASPWEPYPARSGAWAIKEDVAERYSTPRDILEARECLEELMAAT